MARKDRQGPSLELVIGDGKAADAPQAELWICSKDPAVRPLVSRLQQLMNAALDAGLAANFWPREKMLMIRSPLILPTDDEGHAMPGWLALRIEKVDGVEDSRRRLVLSTQQAMDAMEFVPHIDASGVARVACNMDMRKAKGM